MTTVRKSITFTKQQDAWIKSQIEGGDYTNDSEYIRDLIRKDQANNSKLNYLRMAVQKGLDSDVSEKSVQDIIKAKIKEKQ
ncbi:type II toxin-antitoxin system ParD family antitoxin [uncultured Tenacibaculum sp.]|uniref:type II toxin-antitoxin system ParD family antitoxin n=1 Tax=uncultured Tenacibaculum sp. TaxID=174713 RepID=UPI00261B1BBD|nr:type II toxin-antitoxin system ParD family antitoxin [uncultured Tenacibaculum sp.]